jgi:hypothetical protein
MLADTYTRDRLTTVADNPATPLVDESTGPWGEAITQEGGTTTAGEVETTQDVACMWLDAGSLLRSGSGTLILDTPVLLVSSDDPIQIGDQVRNVTDRESIVKLIGPSVVETTNDYGPPGYSAMRALKLRDVKSV